MSNFHNLLSCLSCSPRFYHLASASSRHYQIWPSDYKRKYACVSKRHYQIIGPSDLIIMHACPPYIQHYEICPSDLMCLQKTFSDFRPSDFIYESMPVLQNSITRLGKASKKIDFFLGKSPKLWVGGGQEF